MNEPNDTAGQWHDGLRVEPTREAIEAPLRARIAEQHVLLQAAYAAIDPQEHRELSTAISEAIDDARCVPECKTIAGQAAEIERLRSQNHEAAARRDREHARDASDIARLRACLERGAQMLEDPAGSGLGFSPNQQAAVASVLAKLEASEARVKELERSISDHFTAVHFGKEGMDLEVGARADERRRWLRVAGLLSDIDNPMLPEMVVRHIRADERCKAEGELSEARGIIVALLCYLENVRSFENAPDVARDWLARSQPATQNTPNGGAGFACCSARTPATTAENLGERPSPPPTLREELSSPRAEEE
jgi:hypothetical protein